MPAACMSGLSALRARQRPLGASDRENRAAIETGLCQVEVQLLLLLLLLFVEIFNKNINRSKLIILVKFSNINLL
jgi:hypothetical protein